MECVEGKKTHGHRDMAVHRCPRVDGLWPWSAGRPILSASGRHTRNPGLRAGCRSIHHCSKGICPASERLCEIVQMVSNALLVSNASVRRCKSMVLVGAVGIEPNTRGAELSRFYPVWP